jgi:hypothetical protein
MKAYLASLHAIWLDLTNKRLQYFVELVENSNPTTLIEFFKFFDIQCCFFSENFGKSENNTICAKLEKILQYFDPRFWHFKY